MEIAIAHDTERAEELLDEGWTLFNSGANIYQNSGQARSWFHFFKVSGSHE